MSNLLKNSLLLVTLLFTLAVFQSCKQDGCTDPSAENYDPDADNDDGTCINARTKFIGTYEASQTCDGADVTMSIVTIAESASAINAISVTNDNNGITVNGLVSGVNFSIDDTFDQNGQEINMLGGGIYSETDDGGERIDFDYILSTTIDGDSTSRVCFAVWQKN